jgi:hypothetical protein
MGFCYVINMSGIYTNFWQDLFVVGIEVNVNKVSTFCVLGTGFFLRVFLFVAKAAIIHRKLYEKW